MEMFVALMTLPSPGSLIGLSSSQMIRPVGSSMTDHNDGNATMWLPGKVVIVCLIHSRTSSRPRMVPAACSMYSTSGVYCSTQASQSRVSAARATVPVAGRSSAPKRTWRHATRHWPRFKRWKVKAQIMLIATRNFTLDRTLGAIELLRQDGITGPKAWLGLLDYMWLRPGMMRKIFGAWAAYFLPGFHPWNEDDRNLIKKYEAEAALGTESVKKVRRAA